MVYAVAISPAGNLITADGWTAPAPTDHIYLFNRTTGDMTGRINDLPNVTLHHSGIDYGDLMAVAWSADGTSCQPTPQWPRTPGVEMRFERTIFAAGP